MDLQRTFVALGAVFGGIAVALGAFGAHALRASLSPRDLEIFETGVRYQMYHALALVLVGILWAWRPHASLLTAGWLFVAGITVFSGSLYLLVVTNTRWLGAVTPLGGVAFILAWGFVAWAALRPTAGS